MMDQQELSRRSGIGRHGPDPSGQAGVKVLREYLRAVSQMPQVPLQLEHLVGNRIAFTSPRMELVNCLDRLHLLATIT
jgi:hypothetical protein